MPGSLEALRLLDEVQHLPQLESFDPQRFVARAGEELARMTGETLDDIGAQLDAVGGALVEIDRFTQKCMGIWLDRALANVPAPPQLRRLFGATIVSYDGNLPLFRSRVADALLRIDPAAGAAVAELSAAAEQVLGARGSLRAGMFELARRVTETRLPQVDRASRDRGLNEAERLHWRKARVDVAAVAAHPEMLQGASFADRLSRIEPPPEEPAPEPTGSRFSLLEID
jgi:hypothetical protein